MATKTINFKMSIPQIIFGALWVGILVILAVLIIVQFGDAMFITPGWNYQRAEIIDWLWIGQFVLVGINFGLWCPQ